MPASTQVLYFHLGHHSDDDGFVYPKKIMRMVNSGEDDLKILLAKKFIISFESGIVVQKHWRVNNYIRSDRYRPTTHREEMAQLRPDKGEVYRLDTTGIPSGSISKEVSKKEEENFSSKERELTQVEREAKAAAIRKQLGGLQGKMTM